MARGAFAKLGEKGPDMKWFFAFHQNENPHIEFLIRVAVSSARRHTSLEPHCLYDGDETPLTEWLQQQGVTVWPMRSRFYELFAARAQERAQRWPEQGEGSWLWIAPGTFLRLELPNLCAEQFPDEKFALYTDVDVMFLRDPQPLLEPMKPRFFASAPESWPDKPLHMNAGVMWCNLRAFQAVEEQFEQFVWARLRRIIRRSWDLMPHCQRIDITDQATYRTFFNPFHLKLWRLGVGDRLAYKFLLKPPFSRPQCFTARTELEAVLGTQSRSGRRAFSRAKTLSTRGLARRGRALDASPSTHR